MTEVNIREVVKTDYAFIHELLYETWYADEKQSSEMNRTLAEISLNHYFNRSTFGLVAEINGEQLGFVLAVVREEEPKLRLLQADPYELLFPLFKAPKNELKKELANQKRELDLNEEMLIEATTEFDAEICLFIVSPKGRGKGVGNRLYRTALDKFKSYGVEHYYLFTDDGSHYSFYEKRNLLRINTRPFNPAETIEDSAFNLYLYEGLIK